MTSVLLITLYTDVFCFVNILGMMGKTCPFRTDDAFSTDCTDNGMYCNAATNLCDCDSDNGWYYDGITCSQGNNNSPTDGPEHIARVFVSHTFTCLLLLNILANILLVRKQAKCARIQIQFIKMSSHFFNYLTDVRGINQSQK